MSNDLSRPVVDIGGQAERNRVMNRWIAAEARRGEKPAAAVLARLAGRSPSPTLDTTTEDRRQRLDAAFADREVALRDGDEIALSIADDKIDALFAEARAAREQPRDEQGQFASFDGGVQGRRPVRGPGGMTTATARELMAQAMVASRQERIERGAEQTIVACNF